MTDDALIGQWLAATVIFGGVALALLNLAPQLGKTSHRANDGDDEPLMVRLARGASPLAERLLPAALLDAMERAHPPAGTPWPHERRVLGGLCLVWGLYPTVALFTVAVAVGHAGLYFATALALPVGCALPLLDLKSRADERERAIARAMPWMLDLVVLSLRSGAALEAALAAYAETCGDEVLPEEVERMVVAIRHGETREQVLARFAQRCPFEAIEEFVRALQSLNRIGRSITGVLATLAHDLRASAVQREEAAAAAAGEQMLVPLILMGVAFMVIILAPFVGNLSQMM